MAFEPDCIGANGAGEFGLEAALQHATATRRQWRAWARHQPALAGLDDQQLRRELTVAGQDRKDSLLAALVLLAQSGPHADAALMVLARCLLPGLRRRIARRAPDLDRPEAVAVAVAGLTERVHAYHPARPARFVATYLQETPSDRLRRADAVERRWASYHRNTPEAAIDPNTDVAGLPARTVVTVAVDAGVLSAADAWLICATRAGGLHLRDLRAAAECLGISYAAAVKRRQRAERRWAAWWSPDHLDGAHRGRR